MTKRDELGQIICDMEALTPPDRLRLAAKLLEERKPQLAQVAIDRVAAEVSFALARRGK